ncbi:MAG TPA: hypothetical protein VJV23_14180 [Candidatus Polarisedimenticolia bacterium]|nr:hypothetical protein [Candidatus Polarisedimenticolia bacterium]
MLSCVAGCAGRGLRTEPAPHPGPASSLRISGKGRIDLERDTLRFEAAVALRLPDRLRVEVAGPLGGTRAVLAMRGDRVIVLLPAERAYLLETAGPGLFESLLGVRIDGPSLVRALAAAAEPGHRGTVGPAGEDAFFVSHAEDRLTIAPVRPARDGFRRLELRVRELERTAADSLPDALFAPEAPEHWRRLGPPGSISGGPLLLP